MRAARIFIKTLIGLFFISALFGMWYKRTYSMKKSPSFSLNTPDKEDRLLILTQGSEYKEGVVKEVSEYYSAKDYFVQVHDISLIPKVQFEQWDASMLLHTWELERAPKEVRDLIDSNADLSTVVFFTTSGAGDRFPHEVDAITGASLMSDISRKSQESITQLNNIISFKSLVN